MLMQECLSWLGLFNALAGKKKRRRPRSVQFGDVVRVGDGFGKRYGIWTGENFIQFAKDGHGKRVVHAASFQGFLRGAEHFAVCEFPERYGHPKEWELPVTKPSFVVMPQEKIWRLIAQGAKAKKYRVCGPEETVASAKSRLGETGFLTGEHFAMWCKTGIAESHSLEKLREWWDMMVMY